MIVRYFCADYIKKKLPSESLLKFEKSKKKKRVFPTLKIQIDLNHNPNRPKPRRTFRVYLVRFGTVLFGAIWTFCIWLYQDFSKCVQIRTSLYLVTFGTSVFGAIWKLAPLDVFGIFALRRFSSNIQIHPNPKHQIHPNPLYLGNFPHLCSTTSTTQY